MTSTQTTTPAATSSNLTAAEIAQLNSKLVHYTVVDDFQQAVTFETKRRERGIPEVFTGTGYLVAVEDVADLIDLAEAVNRADDEERAADGLEPRDAGRRLFLEFAAPHRSAVWELDDIPTRDIVALVERAGQCDFRWTEDEEGTGAGTWCVSNDIRYYDLYAESDDEAANNENEAARQALVNLIDSGEPAFDMAAALSVEMYLVLSETAHGKRHWAVVRDVDASTDATERRYVVGPALMGPDDYPTEEDAAEALALSSAYSLVGEGWISDDDEEK